MGYIYKITNTVNNKSYIGISIHEPEKRRIREHLSGRGNRVIANAVKKYGKAAFTYEILEANVFDEFLPDLEVAYIANHNTIAPNGYNLDSGGGGAGSPSEDTLCKMSEARKGKKRPPFSAEHRRKLSEASKGEKNPFYGRTHSAETLRKISQSKKGKKVSAEHIQKVAEANRGKKRSVESRRKMSEAQRGKTVSTETRRKISEAHKGKTISKESRRKMSEAQRGEKHHNFGKSLSTETRRKISATLKGRYKGEKNPNFGKKHSGEARRKISEANRLPEYAAAHKFFFSLPPDIPLKEKRKLLYAKFPSVIKDRIRLWVRKWTS